MVAENKLRKIKAKLLQGVGYLHRQKQTLKIKSEKVNKSGK